MFEPQVSPSKRRVALDADLALAGFTVVAVILANALWNVVGPTLVEVLSALVQTGVTTRLVLLGLFAAGAFGVFVFRTLLPVWYGRAACVVAVVVAWNMIARLAIQIQAADVVALVGAAYLLVRGLVHIQAGETAN
jgi:hypothetical protein